MTTATEQHEIDRLREDNSRLRARINDVSVETVVTRADKRVALRAPDRYREMMERRAVDMLARYLLKNGLITFRERPIDEESVAFIAELRAVRTLESQKVSGAREIFTPSEGADDYWLEEYGMSLVQKDEAMRRRIFSGEHVYVTFGLLPILYPLMSSEVAAAARNATVCVLLDPDLNKVRAQVVSR